MRFTTRTDRCVTILMIEFDWKCDQKIALVYNTCSPSGVTDVFHALLSKTLKMSRLAVIIRDYHIRANGWYDQLQERKERNGNLYLDKSTRPTIVGEPLQPASIFPSYHVSNWFKIDIVVFECRLEYR